MARADTFPNARTPWPRQALLMALLGTLLSLATAVGAYLHNAQRVEREFGTLVDGLHAEVLHELEEARWSVRSLRALWDSSEAVTEVEFSRFARKLIEYDDAAIELHFYARRFDVETRGRDGRSALELEYALRRDGRAPAPSSELESNPAWNQLVGAVSTAADAVLQRDCVGEPRAMPSVLAADAILRPRRSGQAQSGDLELAGIVVARFDVDTLMRRALRSVHEPVMDVALFEKHSADPLFATRRITDTASTRKIEVEGSDLAWTLRVAPNMRWRSEHRSPWPILIALLGITSSLAVAWYIRALEQRRISLSRANAELYTEVADRHTIEKELRETQRALATLVSNLPGIAYRCTNDRDWSMEFISDGCIALTGWTPSDFLSAKISFGRDLIHPDDRQYVWNAVQQAIDARKPFQVRYRVRMRDGSERTFWEQGRGVFSRAGELLAIEGLMIDISEQKRFEDELRRQTGYLRTTIESLPGTFYVFAEPGRFHSWNHNVERITGYSGAELKTMDATEFFDPDVRPRIAAAVAQVFTEGSTYVEAPMRTKGGESIPFAFSARRFEHGGVRYMVGVGLDDSVRESARADRATLRAHIVHSQKLETLGLMAGAVAHDFDNLLTVVFGLTGLAKRALEPGSPAQELLEQALGASNSARALTSQLLALAEAHESSPVEVDVSEVLSATRKLLHASISSRIRVEYDFARDLPRVQLDPADLRQLVLNLVLNAAEASLETGGAVTVTTTLRRTDAARPESSRTLGSPRPGDCVVVTVADRGTGMTHETLHRLGEPFFTTGRIGRGLGWPAVVEIARSWQGWVEVTTRIGHGTTVDVLIPVRAPSSAQLEDPERASS